MQTGAEQADLICLHLINLISAKMEQKLHLYMQIEICDLRLVFIYRVTYTHMLIPVPYGSICCTYHQLKYSSPNRSKKQKQKSHKRTYLSENGGLGKKREWVKSRKDSPGKLRQKFHQSQELIIRGWAAVFCGTWLYSEKTTRKFHGGGGGGGGWRGNPNWDCVYKIST